MSGLAQSILSRLQGVFTGGPSTRFDDVFSQGASQLALSPKNRRLFERSVKYMDDVCKECQSPRLNLKNSPPFILDILPETYQVLVQIFTKNPDILRDNNYLTIFIENLQWKSKAVLKLFRAGATAVFDERSPERRHLTKLSLIFSHMLSELKAEFPNGNFIGSKFRITKKEAAQFWKESFKNRTCVPWNEFQVELEKTHIITKLEILALRGTVDLTCNDHVSNFEFDVFTRLFYPWKSLLRNWQLLTAAHPGYVAFLTYDEVKKKLEKLTNKPGSYVFRLSCTRLGQWAIGYVAPDGKIYQTIPQNKSLIQALIEGAKEGFYLYPNGQQNDINLTSALDQPQADRIKVTPDQYEIYCKMGTTFEMCKICDDNDKNIKLEPCGHLLCTPCLTSWQDSQSGNTCPWCREEIKGTAKVVIESYSPNASPECAQLVDVDSGDSGFSQKFSSLPPRNQAPRLADVGRPRMPSPIQQLPIHKEKAPDPRPVCRPIPVMGVRFKLTRNTRSFHSTKDSIISMPAEFNRRTPPLLPPRRASPASGSTVSEPQISLAETDFLPVAPPPPIHPRLSQKSASDIVYVNVDPNPSTPAYVNASVCSGRSA